MDTLSLVLADQTRREIMTLLAERERAAGELVAAFALSQPAISRHLRVLREAGLVRVRGEGRQRIYRLDAAPLADYRHFWSARLDDLERRIEERRASRESRESPEEK